MTGGEVVAKSVALHGTDTVFGIPGNHNLGIYQYLASSGISHFLNRHEQGCGFAADGYARTTGRPGVALVTAGPAVLNTLTAIGQAYSDSVPMLVVSPGMPVRHRHRGNGHLHETKDQQAAVDAVAKISHRVTSVDEISEAVAQAFTDMLGGRPRPVHLEIPIDVLDESADIDLVDPVQTPTPVPPSQLLTDAAHLLSRARRPGIVVGGGGKGAADNVRRLAERLGAPTVTTTNGKGVLPEDHELALGAGAHLAAVRDWVASRDGLIVIGSDLGSADLWNGPWDVDAPI
ncbi:MAG: thiamine pyrophosphate-binding protein, partial [Pseudonocardiaceae bacterium]